MTPTRFTEREEQSLGAPRMEVTGGVTSRTFTGETVRIGRAMDNDVVVLNPSVSRHHAELRHDGARWELIDLDSRQGTFLDGERVARHAIDDAIEVVVGRPPRGESLRLVPLEPESGADTTPAAPMAATADRLPLILADPPTRKLYRRGRS